jgi:hypothetical protein
MSPEFMVVGEAPGFVAVWLVPEVVAMRYAWASLGLILVA